MIWIWMEYSGPVMWAILFTSIACLTIFLERMFHFHRARIQTADFLDGIYTVLKRHNIVEAVSISTETPGPVAQIVRAAVLNHDEDVRTIQRAMEQAGLEEIPRLELHLPLYAVLVRCLPMLGLLGTVLGMIQVLMAFEQMAPLVQSGDLAGGLWRALLTSAAGLTAAIPAYIGYQFLLTRMETLLLDMEYAASEMTRFMAVNRFKMTPLMEEEG